MAKKKYYAVRKGRTTGIFESWDECRKNVIGMSGASYKSFPTYADAEAYMKLGDAADKEPDVGNTLIAYVDGSFNVKKKKYSFGCVLITPEGELFKANGFDNKPEALVNRNVAGELEGALYAVKWAVENGYGKLLIRHDYEGIAKWHTGEWQAKSYSAKAYLDCLSTYKNQIEISFEKVKAHAGDHYNEMADQLAAQALENEGAG